MCSECVVGVIHVPLCEKTAETILTVLSHRDRRCLTENQLLSVARVLLTDLAVHTEDGIYRQGGATHEQIAAIADFFQPSP